MLWAGLLLFLAVPLACPLLVNLAAPGYASAAEAILINGGTITFALAVVSGVASLLNGLLAGLLGATLISRERECQSWTFLRLTTLTSVEIIGGKLTAVLRSLAWPLHFALALRLLALGAGLATLVLAAAASGLTWEAVLAIWNSLAGEFANANGLALQLSLLVSLPIGLAYWLLEPYFSALYAAGVGLAASTMARSRGTAIVLTVAVHLGLGLGVYAPAQQAMSLGMVLLMPNAPSLVLGLLPLYSVTGPIMAQTGLQAGVLVACLLFAFHRAERLSE